MWLLIIIGVGCLSGFILFRKNILAADQEYFQGPEKLSIIIPARNEEYNLRLLLDSLQLQTITPMKLLLWMTSRRIGPRKLPKAVELRLLQIAVSLRDGRARAGQYGMDICKPRAIFLLFWMQISG